MDCPTEDECPGASRVLRARSRVELSAPKHAREDGGRCIPANPNSGLMYVQPNDGRDIGPAIHNCARLRTLDFSLRIAARRRRIETWQIGRDTVERRVAAVRLLTKVRPTFRYRCNLPRAEMPRVRVLAHRCLWRADTGLRNRSSESRRESPAGGA